MQSGTTHAAHQAITARGLSSGAGLAKEQRPTQHRQSAGLLQTIISVAAWATVLRPCVLTPSGPATAATQVLHACAGMPSIGSAETSHLRKQHNEGHIAGNMSSWCRVISSAAAWIVSSELVQFGILLKCAAMYIRDLGVSCSSRQTVTCLWSDQALMTLCARTCIRAQDFVVVSESAMLMVRPHVLCLHKLY